MQEDDPDPATRAYHEAGHVLMACLLGGRVVAATIENEHGDAGTQVEWRGLDAAERRRRSALVALAGPVAEARWRGDVTLLDAVSAWRGDWHEVAAALQAAVPDREREPLLQRWLDEVRARLWEPAAWERLCRVADLLEAHGDIDDELLADVFA